MRKLVVLGLLLAATTGCGRGWFPHLFRGAPCNGLCSTPAPSLHNDCEGCAPGYGAGYEGYGEGEVIHSGADMGFESVPVGSAPIISQPMAPLAAPGAAPAR